MVVRVYTFILDAKPVAEKVVSEARVLEQISLQTVKCTRFIAKYAHDRPFCASDTIVDTSAF